MTIEDRRSKEPLILPTYPHGTIVNGKRVKRVYSDLTVRQLLYNLIRREGSMAKAAKKIGISRAFLSQVMSGKVQPGNRIAEFFDFDRHVIYVRRKPGPALHGAALPKRDEDGGMIIDIDPKFLEEFPQFQPPVGDVGDQENSQEG